MAFSWGADRWRSYGANSCRQIWVARYFASPHVTNNRLQGANPLEVAHDGGALRGREAWDPAPAGYGSLANWALIRIFNAV
jgi:hypothetical protein